MCRRHAWCSWLCRSACDGPSLRGRACGLWQGENDVSEFNSSVSAAASPSLGFPFYSCQLGASSAKQHADVHRALHVQQPNRFTCVHASPLQVT